MRKRRNILTARANFLAWLSETLFLVLLIPGSLNDSQVCVWQYRHLSGGSLPMQWNFWLMVGYHWKPLPSANGCVSNIIDHSIAPVTIVYVCWCCRLSTWPSPPAPSRSSTTPASRATWSGCGSLSSTWLVWAPRFSKKVPIKFQCLIECNTRGKTILILDICNSYNRLSVFPFRNFVVWGQKRIS